MHFLGLVVFSATIAASKAALVGLALTWAVILAGCWIGWQLLRQNGRLLLQLDELEKRLDELEFGEGEERAGLRVGSEAPAFALPSLAGDRKSLAQYRGQPVLLIFFNPACGFCHEMLPKLREKIENRKQRAEMGAGAQSEPPFVLVISTGDSEANRELFDEQQLTCPVLLQKESEVAAAYQAKGTPSGYLIDAEGKIASELAVGAEALLALGNGSPMGESGRRLGEGSRADRFSNRSLDRSKIKRDGLKAGTTAPDFRLPRLDGHDELALSELRGRPVLLVFSSPGCGPCNTLAPELEKLHRQTLTLDSSPVGREKGTAVVMISKGEPKQNREKVKEQGLTFPIVLQQQWEISRRYAMFATPIAYLIDEAGVIVQNVAVGVEPIMALMAKAKATDLVPEPAGAQR